MIHGAEGWDEATPIGPFVCYDVSDGRVGRQVRDPEAAGLARCTAADLRGGDPAANAARLRQALRGEDSKGHEDALIAGAALALEVTGKARSFAEGVGQARAAIESGAGVRFFERFDAFAAAERARSGGA